MSSNTTPVSSKKEETKKVVSNDRFVIVHGETLYKADQPIHYFERMKDGKPQWSKTMTYAVKFTAESEAVDFIKKNNILKGLVNKITL